MWPFKLGSSASKPSSPTGGSPAAKGKGLVGRTSSSNRAKTVPETPAPAEVALKISIVGDAQAGKTSLVRRFCDDRYSEEYIQTPGVNYVEKRIKLGSSTSDVVFTLNDLGSDSTSAELLPLVCDDAVAIIFVFDLTRKQSLLSIKELYRQVRTMNKRALVMLVGCKFDLYLDLEAEDQEDIAFQARRYARAMKAPLVFTSASHSINVQKVFKIMFGSLFSIDCKVERITGSLEPLIEY